MLAVSLRTLHTTSHSTTSHFTPRLHFPAAALPRPILSRFPHCACMPLAHAAALHKKKSNLSFLLSLQTTLVEPRFNRLTVFDPRFPHGVRLVEGTMNPPQVRYVVLCLCV